MNSINDIADMYRHDFRSYIDFSYNLLHPNQPLQDNWHLDLLGGVIQELVNKGTKRLIINMPPRMLKSHCTSVALPTWLLGRNPATKILCLHASDVLARELHDSAKSIMTHARYRSLFPSTVISNDKRKIQTTFGGKRLHMPFMTSLTGLGADYIIIDDPISATDASNKSARDNVNKQFDQNIIQRLNNKSNGCIIIVMQRLHEDDLCGHILKKRGGWVHLNIPAIAVSNNICSLPYSKKHHWLKGQALHEARESLEDLKKILWSIGGYAFAYQYLQGLYQPHFGEDGSGGIWLSSAREGKFFDFQKNTNPHGFFNMNEANLIMAKVFGEGTDLYPDNMRFDFTLEELTLQGEYLRQKMLERQKKYQEK